MLLKCVLLSYFFPVGLNHGGPIMVSGVALLLHEPLLVPVDADNVGVPRGVPIFLVVTNLPVSNLLGQ